MDRHVAKRRLGRWLAKVRTLESLETQRGGKREQQKTTQLHHNATRPQLIVSSTTDRILYVLLYPFKEL